MKPSIVLQTDFSLSWSAVSEMKGVIRMVDHDVEIVDGSRCWYRPKGMCGAFE